MRLFAADGFDRDSLPPVLAAQRTAALELAEKKQQERVDAAEALPAREQANLPKCFCPGQGYIPLWEAFGGKAIEDLLHVIDLVDARWLVDLADANAIAPRWQQVPHAARIGCNELWRLRFAWEERNCLAVVVLSYPWLDAYHPDKHGLQLRQLANVLRPMLTSVGSAHGTVGVFWDWEGSLRFTTAVDRQLVSDLYRSGFTSAFDTYAALKREDNVLYYSDLGWAAQDALCLKVALAYVARHCSLSAGGIVIDLTRNDFGEEDEEALRDALEPCGESVQLRFDY